MTLSKDFTSRLLAGFGTAVLLAGVGLFASSRPAHTEGGPVPVVVSNAPLPVLNRDTDNAARQPFQTSAFFQTASGAIKRGLAVPTRTLVEIPVPDGKRLVIQGVSITEASYLSGERPSATLATTADGRLAVHTLGYFAAGAGTSSALAYQPVTVYADAGSTVVIELLNTTEVFPKKRLKGAPASFSGPEGTVTGYLVDVP